MPGPHLPDKLRERAISLFEGGKGYKSISRELGLSRDVVRGWIQTYKTTGRREYVCKNGSGNKCLEQLRAGVIARYRDEGADEIELEKRVRRKQERAEEKYKEAREAYENGDDSLFKVAEQFGLKYNSFREFLLRFHPESRIVHSYNRQRKELIREIQAQVEMTARLSKIY